MSVTANDRRYGIANISGAAQTVSCDFRIQDDSDALVVYYTGTSASWSATGKVLNTHYTIANKTSSGFDVVFAAGVGVSGDKVVVLDKRSAKTYATFVSGDPLPPETLQALFYDILVEFIQRDEERIGRCLQVPPESTAKTTADQTTVTTQVPDFPTTHTTTMYLGYTTDNALTWSAPADFDATVSAFMATVLDDVDAAAARTTLGAAATTDLLDYLLIDGSRAMAGTLDMDGNTITMGGAQINMETAKIVNVTDPTSAQDAATKNYVDTTFFDPLAVHFLYDDFAGGYEDDANGIVLSGLPWNVTASGTSASVQFDDGSRAADSDHPGVLTLDTGGDTNGYAVIGYSSTGTGANNGVFLGGGETSFTWLVYINTLADGTNDYEILLGLDDGSSTTAPANGVYFLYDRDTSANWLISSAAASTATETDSSTAVATGWTKVKAVVNAAGTSIQYYINGSSVGTVTTNISTSAALRRRAIIVKEAGTSARFLDIDYFEQKVTLTNAR